MSDDGAAFREMLRALIDADDDMSQCKLAKKIHINDGYLSRIVNGHRLPSVEIARLLDDGLDAGGRLVALMPVREPRAESKPTGYESMPPAGTLNQGHVLDHGDDDMRRRAALQAIAALGAGAAIPAYVIETVFSGIEDALRDGFDVAEWDRVVHEYGLQLLSRPAGSLVKDVAADIVVIGELLRRSVKTAERTELFRVGAGLSALLAMDLSDMRDGRGARVSWGKARRLADASGDRDLGVWVRAKEAQKSCWAERSDVLIEELVDEAIGLSDQKASSGLARAYAARSYVAAERGDPVTATAALGDFRKVFGDLPPGHRESGAMGLQEAQLFWSEAYVRVLIDDSQAETFLERALECADGPIWDEEVELMRALWMVKKREIAAGLGHAVSKLQVRPLSSFRRRLVVRILDALPAEGRALPDARVLRVLASG